MRLLAFKVGQATKPIGRVMYMIDTQAYRTYFFLGIF